MTGHENAEPLEAAGSEEWEDATIVVTPDDATVAVPVTDHTVVVTNADRGSNDATVALTKGDLLDATVMASGGVNSHPNVLPPRASARTWTSPQPNTGGAPVEEPEEIPASLARLLFKAPLDPKRRAPESPFPKDQSALPRGGVRAGMPVVYGTRPEVLPVIPEGTDFSTWIGPPPEGHDIGVADRTAVISTERFNRRYQRIALFGGAGVTAAVAVGLWWVIDSLF